MRSHAVLALLAGAAIANPVPQDIDWEAVDSLEPVPEPSIPVVNAVAAQTTVPFSAAPAASSVAAAVSANPTDTSLKMAKRAVNNDGCAVQPAEDDTAEAFLDNEEYDDAANSATIPAGYYQAYADKQGSSEGVYGYMGYSVLDTYDVAQCSERCNAIQGCMSINIYFERDPSVDPTATCTNPPSEEVIKCVYWGGPVTEASATNVGQYRRDFHVVIAGSNGYVNKSIATPDGYQPPVALGDAAINAPLDCNKKDTYMGSKYNLAHPPKNGVAQTCQFFNTYILYKNSQSVGQYCSLYSETWPATFATNRGQWRGNDHYTIGQSFAFSNNTANADKPSGCMNPTSPK
ncbi:hypothetical protein KC318_g4057 [Hortaea werneckii]|uniref:Apple domain-containing protein n=1 Tax=Hortaea werneckii TaxID=91943 RepID=A0A3M7BIP1_HORWE|nr:hypothetical protein KC334_g4217 [Hortaea werneckii]KAI7017587.1 hypothetical protein KC355_g3619 [Hortaea werneckii]KAI7670424.1 hypothetical protein KC318_g4057 [Hortaea werneckii]RMY17205.1 hypothetical protein D0867_06197 [Hortaea werneckii]RMY39588.1 hypothetical protein D0866_01828 [Hortaea werneckii]